MDAIQRRANEPSIAARLTAALAANDTAAAWQDLVTYRDALENRYGAVEAEVNAAGYELMRRGDVEHAREMFALNARAFPNSANAYDSLADADEHLGRRDDAIAMYRRALSIDPSLPSSREALARLRAAP
jgi:tetratricopeptide (TPR) repeat protein